MAAGSRFRSSSALLFLMLAPGIAGSAVGQPVAYDDIVKSFRANNFSQAAADARKLLEAHPDHVQARYMLGVSLYQLHRYADALPELTRVVEQAPGNPQFVVMLARAQRGNHDRSSALRTLSGVVGDLAAQSERSLGEKPESGTSADASHDLLDGTVQLLVDTARGMGAEATPVLEDAVERLPSEEILWRALAEGYVAGERYDEAFDTYRRAAEQLPGIVGLAQSAYNLAGKRATEQEKGSAAQTAWYRRAAEAADWMVAAKPSSETLHASGKAWLLAGDPANAQKRLNRAAGEGPIDAALALDLGRCARDLGELDAAQQHFEQALAMHPEPKEEQRIYGVFARLQQQRGDLEAAAKAYRRAGEIVQAEGIEKALAQRAQCRSLRDQLEALIAEADAAAVDAGPALDALRQTIAAQCAEVLE